MTSNAVFFCVNIKKSLAKINEREKKEVELAVQPDIWIALICYNFIVLWTREWFKSRDDKTSYI
jgi:hypothetical protein